jgi:ribonucleoside-diphosphate reductase beta chain
MGEHSISVPTIRRNMSVFNESNTGWKSGRYPLFLGQAPALHDSINVNFPTIEKLAKKQVSQRWVFDEFNHEQSRMDLLKCPKAIYQVMLMNLAYQWEADSVASRAIAPVFAPFVTNSELWEALMENTNMEVTHTKTYSNIVQQCVADPSDVFKMVMESEQTLTRAGTVNKALSELQTIGAIVTLQRSGYKGFVVNQDEVYNTVFRGVVALYLLERLQFMASFPATFAIVEQGYCQSIGKAVQKIMLDEIDVHAALDREILRIEMATPRGKAAMASSRYLIENMLYEVVNREYDWADHLFSDGRSIVGLNPVLLKEWILYNAQEVARELGIDWKYAIIKSNPLPWMENWIDIDKTQNAMQEADGNNYALNVVKDDLGDDELEF